MLKYLRITNLAVARNVEVEFAEGLNILTGETGAGKSILIDSLAALLGARAGSELIRTGEKAALLEAVFSAPDTRSVAALLEEHGLAVEDGELIVRREITRAGRSRAFVQGVLQPLSVLARIGADLADIHGQHDQRVLLSRDAHREILDASGVPARRKREVVSAHEKALVLSRRLSELGDAAARAHKLDFLLFQINEIDRAAPRPGEYDELKNEQAILSHADRLLELGRDALERLAESDAAVAPNYARALKLVAEIAPFDPELKEQTGGLEEISYRLEEAVGALRRFVLDVRADPARLDEVNSRLALLDRLKAKYGPTIEDVLARLAGAREEVATLTGADELCGRIEADLHGARQAWRAASDRLHEARREAAARMETAVACELKALALDKARFLVTVDRVEGLEAEMAAARNGVDRVEFLISTNPGEDPGPLHKVASGGELSRVMLAIITTGKPAGPSRVMVFDEVDAGIGGGTAEVVGRKLRRLSRRAQVLCVTHLPQIAAFAERHLWVSKAVQKGRTEASVRRLSQEERIEELARMLAGRRITPLTRRHAAEMLSMARERL